MVFDLRKFDDDIRAECSQLQRLLAAQGGVRSTVDEDADVVRRTAPVVSSFKKKLNQIKG